MVGSCSVVVASASGVRKRVVCVIDLLELLRTGRSFGRVTGDSVGVRFQGRAFVCIADLLLGGIGGDREDGI